MALRILRSLNHHHTMQLFSGAVTRKNVFLFRFFQKIRLFPFMSKRFLLITPSISNKLEQPINEEINSEEDFVEKYLDPKDRSRVIPVETSIKYMDSVAFKTTYGEDPVWLHYRRNHPKLWAPKTRETCIRQNKIATGSPCPLCRDEYLVVDYRNIALLNHFLDPYTGQTLPTTKTNICQKKMRLVEIEIERAKDHGLIEVDVPHVEYDYNDYKR